MSIMMKGRNRNVYALKRGGECEIYEFLAGLEEEDPKIAMLDHILSDMVNESEEIIIDYSIEGETEDLFAIVLYGYTILGFTVEQHFYCSHAYENGNTEHQENKPHREEIEKLKSNRNHFLEYKRKQGSTP